MSFREKYQITQCFLTPGSKRRSGKPMSPGVRFIVAHDTGNPESTASGNVRYYENSRDEMSASAHLFVDHREIIECIPALTSKPEKAWHVLYGVPTDNNLFGFNANDAAIGVEYCYGTHIDADEAYRKYVWVMAYACYKYSLNPAASIVGHFFLDPQRKTDPVTGLARSRRTYEQLLRDVVTEFDACRKTQTPVPEVVPATGGTPGTARSVVHLNIRSGAPNTMAKISRTVGPDTVLTFDGWVTDGQPVNGNTKWFRNGNEFFWSGGVAVDETGGIHR